VLRAVLFFATSLRASSSLHGRALSSVLGAPLWWFQANPVGRILNRFTGDLNNADEMLATALFETCQLGLMALAAFVALAIAVPWLLLALPLVIILAWKLRQFATKSMRELKRLEGVTKSPLHSRLIQAAGSLVALRAYGQEASLRHSFEKKLDVNASAWWWWLVCNRLFGLLLDLLTAVLVITLVFVAVGLKGEASDSAFAFALVYSLSLSGLIQYWIRQSALAESFMTSVERLCYFGNSLPQEKAPSVPANRNAGSDADVAASASASAAMTLPSIGTPRGGIVFTDLVVRYRPDMPIVLHGVSATIDAGTKVGIVGRTGAGKSSLLLALLRVNTIESGTITIDDLDAAHTSLRNLRRQVAVIPQMPNLFSGTVRFNLDPSGQHHSNAALCKALREARLLPASSTDSALTTLLEKEVEAGGENFSAGECQLLALARALLRNDATVLALDEATANLDHASDDAIQEALHNAGRARGRTALVIAHRLSSVIDADQILVLSAGRVAEHGPTTELLDRQGEFSSIVNAMGEIGATALRAQAESAAAARRAAD